MTDNDKPLSDEDEALLQEAMQGVNPLTGSNRVTKPRFPKRPPKRTESDHFTPSILSETLHDPVLGALDSVSHFQAGIQTRQIRRFKQGKLPPSSTLDLHGETVSSARQHLQRFIEDAQANGHRCVLVIHGKGTSKSALPKLKNFVCQWLQELPAILGFCSATPQDGGTGAVYVLLKRTESHE